MGPGADASPTLDEETAWRLVRALLAAAREGRAGARVHVAGTPPAWLDARPGGHWETSTRASEPARDLLDLFLPLVVVPDLVVAQLGQSLDGKIATESGDSHYVTGTADIRRLHRLRALVDAVVVGAETVALDDPRLTVREVEGENPVRVVLDPSARLEPVRPVRRVFMDGAARTLLVRAEGQDPTGGSARDVAGSGGGEILTLRADEHGFDPADLLALLRGRGLRRVLVEGGGITVSRFLQAGLLDRLHLTVAPLLIGPGRPALTLPPVETLDLALRPRSRWFRLGDDVLCDLDLR